MKQVTTVGVDLAKAVFTVHGVDAAGHVVLRKTVRRERLIELIASLSPCRTHWQESMSRRGASGRAWDWSAYRLGDHRDHCHGARIRQWAAVRCVAGFGAATIFHGRQTEARAHHQTRRCVPAHAADARCPGGAAECGAENRPPVALGHGAAGTAWLSPDHHRGGREERAHGNTLTGQTGARTPRLTCRPEIEVD